MNAHPDETNFQPEGPQPLLREIAPGAPYPVAALGPLRDAVEAVQLMTLRTEIVKPSAQPQIHQNPGASDDARGIFWGKQKTTISNF